MAPPWWWLGPPSLSFSNYGSFVIFLSFFFFQLVLKINDTFESKRGKKRVKLQPYTGKEAASSKGEHSRFRSSVCSLSVLVSFLLLWPGCRAGREICLALYVDQAGLKLLGLNNPSCVVSRMFWTTGIPYLLRTRFWRVTFLLFKNLYHWKKFFLLYLKLLTSCTKNKK